MPSVLGKHEGGHMLYWGSDEQSRNANGGTEILKRGLWDALSPEERDSVHVICSRVRNVVKGKPNILWFHDLVDDPETRHLADPILRERFAKLVFVTYWQWSLYEHKYGISWDQAIVLPNFVEPFADPGVIWNKPNDGVIRLIYHTTPHRGLELLPSIVRALTERDYNVTCDVFSSFDAYGWPERDAPYKKLFERLSNMAEFTYHGFQPNEVVRAALAKADIFLYPSIWQETSCLAAIEAMSAGVAVVCPGYGALPETCAPNLFMYDWTPDHHEHIQRCIQATVNCINKSPNYWSRIAEQKRIIDAKHGKKGVIAKWRQLIQEIT